MTPFFVGLVALLCAALLARVVPATAARRADMTPILAGRAAPWVLGIVTSLVTAYVWGHLDPVPVVHDEVAYLLQARIFAHGAFVMPAPPLPEFFEQFHAYVTPVYAAKYPPGHPLVLALGVLAGWAPLMPIVLAGLIGALVFLLARRIANPWIALLTWLVWVTGRSTFFPLASYFSESTSEVLWLFGWWALLEWRESGRRAWLVTLSLCVAWMAITRPMTGVAYAIPVGVVVLVRAWRLRAWRDVAVAAAVGSAVLVLVPYANARTTGDWRVSPLSEYSKIYFPFDAPGFGLDSSRPRRALPRDMVQFGEVFRPVHRDYGPRTLAPALGDRVLATANGIWRGPRILLALAALASIPLIGAEVGFALASAATLFLCYLSFAHMASWTIYYAETLPVFALLSALGIWRLMAAADRVRSGSLAEPAPRAALGAALIGLVLLASAPQEWQGRRQNAIDRQSYQYAFRNALRQLPSPRAIVFVRYAPWHNLHFSLIANDPDFATSPVWVAYDRGADNTRLERLAPDRAAYLFDEERLTMMTYPTATAAVSARR